MMTIYEVFYDFFEFLFPSAILVEYADLIELTVFVVTYIFVFSVILIPLYRIATFFLRMGKRL